ncbi:prolipoprotein diacylglyceryl transferase [Alphaproteobacteria bacterium]|nr:prolipoprotein diacylglyceryl transferase [Alphaproteobacteria bacterium]
MEFPNITPTAFTIFGIDIQWYGISYALGIFLALLYSKNLAKKFNSLNQKILDDILIWIALGIIIGGRLGYAIFYDFVFYLNNINLIILGIREGGMSFHGGIIGVIISCLLFSKVKKINFFSIMDIISCSAPIGLFLGRIANFINSELWGKETTFFLGIIFPNGGPNPRHATQLYESFLEGIILFIIINTFYRKYFNKPGYTCSLFLVLYGLFRTLVELLREPDSHIGFIIEPYLTLGMLLCLPMIIIGLTFLYYLNAKYNRK